MAHRSKKVVIPLVPLAVPERAVTMLTSEKAS